MYSVTPEGQQPIVDNIPGIEAGPMWTQAAVESVIPDWMVCLLLLLSSLPLQR